MREIIKDKWFWIVAAVALLLRVWHLYSAALGPTFWAPAVDPLWYHEAAQRIANGDFGPWPLFRAPLYPMLLGTVYAIADNDLLWARLLNLVLQMATLVLIFRVAVAYFGRIAAVIAAGLFAVNGMAIFFCAEILSTSLEMLLAILAVWSTLALRKSPTAKQALVCGLIWGLACITRPNFLMVAPIAIVVALWPVWKPVSIKAAIIAFVALALPVAPVTIANWVKGYEPVLIATQGGVNFWIGNNPQADGVSSILPGSDRFWTLEQATAIAERDSRRNLGPGGVSDYYYSKGRQYLMENPQDALNLMVQKASLFFNRFEVSNNKHIAYFSGQTPGLSLLILLNFALLLPLAVLSLWGRAKPEARVLWCLILAYAATVILFFIASRFRMPVVPWLCLLGGVGLASWSHFSAPHKKLALLAALTVFVIAIFNPYNAREADLGAAHYMEGNAYLALGQYEQARASFELAKSDPGSRELATLNQGVALQKAGRLEDAQTLLLNMVKEFPQSVAAWNNLAVVLEQRQDTASAFNAYHKVLSVDSFHTDARENLVRLLLERGKRFLRDGDPETAQLPLRECVQLIPSAQGYYHLAVAYGQSNRETAARQALGLALRYQPDYEPALTLLQQLQAGEAAPELDLE